MRLPQPQRRQRTSRHCRRRPRRHRPQPSLRCPTRRSPRALPASRNRLSSHQTCRSRSGSCERPQTKKAPTAHCPLSFHSHPPSRAGTDASCKAPRINMFSMNSLAEPRIVAARGFPPANTFLLILKKRGNWLVTPSHRGFSVVQRTWGHGGRKLRAWRALGRI